MRTTTPARPRSRGYAARHGISFEGDVHLEMVVDSTTVCVDGPGGTVTAGPC